MTDRLLLDTHIVLWLDSGHERLAVATCDLIDAYWQSGGTIRVCAVTIWEIALLVDSGHINLGIAIGAWVERFLDRPGVEVVALGHRAAARSYQLHHLEHRDPADRLLIATAIDLGCPLATYDDRVQRFGRRHGRKYGFAVAK